MTRIPLGRCVQGHRVTIDASGKSGFASGRETSPRRRSRCQSSREAGLEAKLEQFLSIPEFLKDSRSNLTVTNQRFFRAS